MEAPLSQLAAMLDECFDYTARRDKTKDRRITPVRDELLGPMQPALLATLAATALILDRVRQRRGPGARAARRAVGPVRGSFGARCEPQRLAQQLIVEVLIVAAVAGVLGSALAWVGFSVVTDALPLGGWAGRRRIGAVRVGDGQRRDRGVARHTRAHRLAVSRRLAQRLERSAVGEKIAGRGGRLESGLVVAQVALAVMIASGAALLARSVANMYAVQPGVRVDGVAVVDVVFDGTLDRASREQTLEELERALRELPGVASVGAAQQLPLRGGGYRRPAYRRTPEIENAATEYRIVTPGDFESLGFALRRGRAIMATTGPKPDVSWSSTRHLPRGTSREWIRSAGRSAATLKRDVRASSGSWRTPLKNV